MDPSPAPDPAWFRAHLVREGEAFARAVAVGPLDVAVAACPGWTVADLAAHLGTIHQWSAACIEHGRRPERDVSVDVGSGDPDEAAGAYRRALARLQDALDDLDPAAATWNPFPVEQVGSFWPRRQAHETALHRWDAQRARGEPDPLDRDLAADGVDEYLAVIVPRRMSRDDLDVPAGRLHLHCTDAEGEWVVHGEAGEYRVARRHARGDAVLRGSASALLLACWGRTGTEDLEVFGDDDVLAGWLGLAGI